MQGLRRLRPNAAHTERSLALLGSCYKDASCLDATPRPQQIIGIQLRANATAF